MVYMGDATVSSSGILVYKDLWSAKEILKKEEASQICFSSYIFRMRLTCPNIV